MKVTPQSTLTHKSLIFILPFVLALFSSQEILAQPGNDLCASAITVIVDIETCTSPTTIGSNVDATDSGEGPICGGGTYSGGDVWYQLTMPAGETTLLVDLLSSLPGGALHAELYDLALGGCGSLGAAAYCSSFLNPSGSEIIPGLTGGNTYLLRFFEGQNDVFGTFEFCLRTITPPPANDLCTGAITVPVDLVSCTSPNTIGTNINTSDSGEGPICGGGTYSGGDVWYQFTMPSGETTLLIDLISFIQAGALHAEIYDLSLGGCGSLGAAVYCSNFLQGNVDEMIPGLTGGNTYLLRLFEGQNDAFGTFEFCLKAGLPPPINDNCAGAIPATFINPIGTGCDNPTVLPFSSDGTTDSGQDGSCDGSSTGLDQFFSWTATVIGLQWDDQSPGNPGIVIWDATCTTEIDCAGTFRNATLSGWAIGDDLVIQIYDFENDFSDVAFCLEEIPCLNAATFTTTVDFTNCATDMYNIEVVVSDLGFATGVDISNDINGSSFTNVGLGTYTLSGFDSNSGGVKVTVSDNTDPTCLDIITVLIPTMCPPPNDTCAGAIPATFINPQGTGCDTPTVLPFSTDETTDSGQDGSCNGSSTGLDQFFTWTATELALQWIDQAPGNPGIVIWDATCTTEIDCSNTFNSATLSGWAVGENLVIQIYDFDGSVSDVAFCLEEENCLEASFTSSVNESNCDADMYSIEVVVSNLGSAAGVDISNDINGSSLTNVGLGTHTLSGFDGSSGLVTVTVVDNADPTCTNTTTILIPTECPLANNNCAGAIPATFINPPGTGCATPTVLPFSTDGTTDSGQNGSCQGSDTGLDQFFTWTATELALKWEEQDPGNPGIIIWDASCTTEIDCSRTFTNATLSGWAVGDDLVIQIYDFDGALSDVAFCLEEEDCTPAIFTVSVDATNCAMNMFSIDVVVSDLGSATGIDISNDINGSSFTNVGLGTHTLTGFDGTGGLVIVKVADNADTTCESTTTVFVPAACPPINDTCAGAIPATFINPTGTGCNTPTILPFLTDGTTDSGQDGSCDSVDTGFDQFFTWTATDLFLQWNDQSPGNPGIVIWDATCTTEIACTNTFSDAILSGWAIGDDLVIQIYDFENDFSDVAFCLETGAELACASNETAAPDPSCGNIDVLLTWDEVPLASGYKISVGTSSGAVNIEDNTDLLDATSYTLVAPTLSTTYFWTVTPYNAGADATDCSEFSFTTGASLCYCISVPTSNDGDGLIEATIETTTYTSFGDLTYEDHTGGVVEQLTQGSIANFMITFENAGFDYENVVWIDFNDDFTFDASEQVFLGLIEGSSPVTSDLSFTVPPDAQKGVHRMRILAVDDGATLDPCFNGSFAFTLDFNVDIICASEYSAINGNQLIGTETDEVNYETDGILESSQTIDASADITYDSGSEITLLSDFEVVLGAEFHAFIDGCTSIDPLVDESNTTRSKQKENDSNKEKSTADDTGN